MEINISKLNEANVDDVINLGLTTVELNNTAEVFEYYDKDELIEFANSGSDIALVASVDNEFAGFILVAFHSILKEAYIIDMALVKKFRGIKVGSKLFNEVMTKLEEQKCKQVWGIVHDGNESMVEFLETRGFEKGLKFYWMGKEFPESY